MRIWVKLLNGESKIYEVENIVEATMKVNELPGVVDWDVCSFRAPPEDVKPHTTMPLIPF